MCVIFYVNKTRPTDEMITRAWDHNRDGGGIAWREGREVVWKKGFTKLEDFREIINKTPIPFIAHFRVASIGGIKESLTHPFPIGAKASLALQGRTQGGVLFHNGHWNMWHEKALDAAIHSNTPVPRGGDWSDTRAMAFLVSIYGPGLIDLLPQQKGIIMTPDDYYIFTGGGWDRINDVWCSNDNFWRGRKYTHYMANTMGRMCSRGKCMKEAMAGKDVCFECDKARQAEAKEASVKEPDGNKVAEPKKPSAMALLTGATQRPLASVLTLPELETFHKSKDVSKSKYKRFKKLYSQLGTGSNNKKFRVKSALEKLSEEIAETVIEKLAAGSKES